MLGSDFGPTRYNLLKERPKKHIVQFTVSSENKLAQHKIQSEAFQKTTSTLLVKYYFNI